MTKKKTTYFTQAVAASSNTPRQQSHLRRLLIFAVAGSMFGLGFATAIQQERTALVSDLVAAGFEVNGLTQVSNTQLQILWFTKINRFDPIFAIEGTDPDRLGVSITELAARTHEIAQHYKKEDQTLILDTLYPIDFLESLVQTERLRQSVRISPSLGTDIAYSWALFVSASKRQKDAKLLENAIVKTVATSGRYRFLAGEMTRSSIVSALRTIQNESRLASRKSLVRLRCLLWYTRSCPTILAAQTARQLSLTTTDTIKAPASILPLAQSAIAQFAPSNEKPFPVVKINSSCAPFSADEPLVAGYIKTAYANGAGWHFTIADDVLFLDYEARLATSTPQGPSDPTRDPQYPYNRWMKENNMPYLYLFSGGLYLCADAGKDITAMQGIYSVQDRLIKADVKEKDAVAISQAAVLDQVMVANYLRTHAHEPHVDPIIDLYIQGSENFDTVVRGAMQDNAYVLQLARRGGEFPLDQLFLARSYPSVLFLSSNPTFSSTDPTFYSKVVRSPIEHYRMTTYRKLLDRGYTPLELTELVQKGIDFMKNEAVYLPVL